MTLKEFYWKVCEVFNGGKQLPFKYTRKDGYWKMSKGFQNYDGKVISSGLYLKIAKAAREDQEALERSNQLARDKMLQARKQKFKVQTKYLGE